MRLNLIRFLAATSAILLFFVFSSRFTGCTNSGGGSGSGSGTGRNPVPQRIIIGTTKPLPSGSHIELRFRDSVILYTNIPVDIPDTAQLQLRVIAQGDTVNAAYIPE
jgi:hypothetical protein